MNRFVIFTSALLCLAGQSHQFNIQHGTNDYITYEEGGANTRIILSASHGGTEEPGTIPDRPAAGCYDAADDECIYTPGCGILDEVHCEVRTGKDTNTHLLAREVADAIRSKLGGSDNDRPHVVINELRRSKLDANRDLAEATFGNADAATAWHEYHGFIDTAKQAVTGTGNTALYVDIHGQNQDEGWSMVGLLLSKSGENGLGKSLLRDRVSAYSSIKQLHYDSGVSMEELVRGANSIGGLLQAVGYDTVPSPVNPDAGTAKFYSGGYSLRRHTGWLVSGFQLEAHYDLRETQATRVAYAEKVADAILQWINDYY